MSIALKQVFLLTCLIAISGCRETLTNAIPTSTEKPRLKIVTKKAPQKAYERSAPVESQEARIQIASVSPKELIKFDLTIQKRQLRSRCCALW